jgi:hypothetical protein
MTDLLEEKIHRAQSLRAIILAVSLLPGETVMNIK